MAMSKYAYASIVKPQVSGKGWNKVRTAAKAQAKVSENLIARASEIFGKPFNPSDYLLTHATIVASVDTFEPKGMKLGKTTEGGFRVNRKFANFRVTGNTDKYINNNLDCWDREVLAKSYRTFIGAHNFVEHVQIEDLSKGRIIDAVCRDVGESVYVDILIATDRKHTELVEAISSGKMSTLSMGCTVDGTICTKCGHWAADETEMCPHIKYEKGNTFFDKNGKQHRVAELCGHPSLDPTGGVHFIEGSWVGTPAFTGAVLQTILEANQNTELGKAASEMLATPPEQWTSGQRRKAASMVAGHFMAGWDDEDGGDGEGDGEDAAPAEKPESGAFDNLEDELADHMRDRVKKKLKKDMDQKDLDEALGPEDSSSSNENVQKQSVRLAMDDLVPDRSSVTAYGGALTYLCRSATGDADLMNRVAMLNSDYGVTISVPMYRAALQLGSSDGYGSLEVFSRACQAALGRPATLAEAKTLIRLGKLLSRRGQARNGNNSTWLSPKSEGDLR